MKEAVRFAKGHISNPRNMCRLYVQISHIVLKIRLAQAESRTRFCLHVVLGIYYVPAALDGWLHAPITLE